MTDNALKGYYSGFMMDDTSAEIFYFNRNLCGFDENFQSNFFDTVRRKFTSVCLFVENPGLRDTLFKTEEEIRAETPPLHFFVIEKF